ncbi:MAG: 3-phosphoshikimate 1-carboxyvinyltransferase [Thermonemataceae bacterium]|nr:3-phosphoshikimate 1-carboxyvinyltransferase [Thermonemataceae bacterium]
MAKWQNQGQSPYQLKNISEARDTKTLQYILGEKQSIADVGDAGTTMRFLIAFYAATKQKVLLTGSERMQERPIGILVEALKDIGAKIKYVGKEGFPPVEIQGFEQKKQQIYIQSNVSSQYISALLMIAPLLEKGLEITLKEEVYSKPYILMTLSLMQYFGVQSQWEGNKIKISPQNYQLKEYTIEADWSAASYWYSLVAIAEHAQIKMLDLKENSLQGDSIIAKIMENFGVKTTFLTEGVLIEKTKNFENKSLIYNFKDCPDLAQTLVALCVAKNMDFEGEGLESLAIKETNRLEALQKEVAKFGFEFVGEGKKWILRKNKYFISPTNIISVETYKDHRMAMAFAPLAYLRDIRIENPKVVEKSYPTFWEEFKKVTE